ncbi:Predicted nucleic acid-binding protein contains PIN domain, N-term part [Thermococcus gammatolerans EJ3]|uniref:Predicted nucleic acid-binding protein contains PIN domain, N-term part n=1 Tax=Thermococcus gammatolerans (strain DSM 15229 / JCM 11827 / EJ3) TaxID=593117 RepID=C5A2W1_THEGJ|nr:Predicted nucleic acid-binding protein contains PIN domain, N-term part [Thermococcus gammatolerans EJ3]
MFVVDTTVLSNFAKTNSMGVLGKILGETALTTPYVVEEFMVGVSEAGILQLKSLYPSQSSLPRKKDCTDSSARSWERERRPA